MRVIGSGRCLRCRDRASRGSLAIPAEQFEAPVSVEDENPLKPRRDRDVRDLFSVAPDNIFMIKLSYWMSR